MKYLFALFNMLVGAATCLLIDQFADLPWFMYVLLGLSFAVIERLGVYVHE